MLSLSIKFHVSLMSHVVGVKYDFNVVIWPYFQSTPNYGQCALRSMSFQTRVDPLDEAGSSLGSISWRLKLTSEVGRALVIILASDTGMGAAEMSQFGA